MEMSDLYALAASHNHEVVRIALKESPALTIEDSKHLCHIALSTGLSSSGEKTCLAHELGHCEYGGFYNYHSPFELQSRCEAKANRWAYLSVLPLDEIKDALHSGIENIWELADHFGVTPDFMKSCIKFYVEQLGKSFDL